MRKIDIHCHTTRSQLKNIVPPSATLNTIKEAMALHNIKYTVVLASYFPQQGKGISNYRLLHWLDKHPNFLLFGSLDFETYFKTGFAELSELAAEGHLHGVKIYSGYQNIDYNSQAFKKIAELAAFYQLPLMFHGGYIQDYEDDISRAVSPDLFASIVENFPEVSIIVSHLAWPFVDELMAVMAEHKNIMTDTSGMLDSCKTKNTFDACVLALKKFISQLGTDRLLFGTDFPVQTHQDSIQLVEAALEGYAENDREKVYYGNAAALLRVTGNGS